MAFTSESILTISSVLVTAASVGIAILACLWFLKNPVLLRHFVWDRIIGRRSRIRDRTISRAVVEQLDLNQARVFLPGFPFKNIYHARAMIQWCRTNQIGHEEVCGMGEFIKYDGGKIAVSDRSLRAERFFFFLASGLLLTAFFSLFILSFYSGITRSILIKGKESKTWMFIDHEKVKPAAIIFGSPPDWEISGENCRASDRDRLPLTEIEYSSLCDLVATDESVQYVETNLRTNFLGALLLSLVSALGLVRIWRQLEQYQSFVDLRTRLRISQKPLEENCKSPD